MHAVSDSDSWWMRGRIYELYVDKFATNFAGLTERLDYFTFLGINTLHILPHYPSPMVDDGYDISDYKNVRLDLGTLEDFKRFTEAAHRRNIRVMVDLVLNHVSCEHPWFKEARATKHNSFRDFFVWSESSGRRRKSLKQFPDFKDSHWIWNEATQDYYYATFYPEQPDLNWKHPQVLAEILSVIDFWVQKGVNGFRLDAASYLIQKSGAGFVQSLPTHRILKALRAYTDEEYGGRIAFLAEVAGEIEDGLRYFGDGDECHMVYHFPLMREMFLALMHRDRSRVDTMILNSAVLPPKCAWATFLRNHDDIALSRTMNKKERVDLLRFLDPDSQYLFAAGSTTAVRLATIFEHEPERMVEAYNMLYTLPGTPVLYYGDEIGMKNLPHQPHVKDSRRYVRGSFDWNIVESMRADPDSVLNRIAADIRGKA